ncbi:BREX-2 system adenine-specific DNA-methyltransferase PglX [Corallococcus sp. CA053C]|uniref:BREX-2 system adenine-specific DNA-methyltransferase PglX n=1 Tax=Corallococcus sp. CA053C TaxID=2316732 RepID=UPI001315186F|nr:BREX-2 system adenine-specific DNA-methyltransferase PglX [Corallococcus sp. CA053C]
MSRGGKKKGGERTITPELAAFLSKVLVPDLRERVKAPEVRHALEKRYLHEKAANRTAEHFIDWMERTVEQVGAAWVLSCLFIRTLEDRELLGQRRLAGPGAKDAYGQFIEIAPALTARDYLLLVFREVAALPAAEDVLGLRHNPAWRLSPSHEAARKLLDFFQEEDASGTLTWTFSGTDTRFLGDIYQDLSEEVRKRYALLQTPHFVEKFILDLTLDPAIEEFGLEEVRLIDPTCGSGHFLLGAFERLFEKRRLNAPSLDVKEHARAALAQVYGVDLNPYAVAIARFRLALAFLEKAVIRKLAHAPRLSLNLVVADSLLYGGRHQTKLSDLDEDRARWGDELFDLEDPIAARRLFGRRFHAVVGNPPYITCKDEALRDAYRERYDSCYRNYALAAPFAERFFELAVEQGFVGMINANSFMKREFGRRLVEDVLRNLDLSRVIDTSGAFIPGHGTPTVLLFGRNRVPVADSVAAVLGKRGEPITPENPEAGLVWSSIVENYDLSGFENDFISVAPVGRLVLSRHPWALGGGGTSALKEILESGAGKTLEDVVEAIGRTTVCGEDEVWIAPRGTCRRNTASECVVPLVVGENVRDWWIDESLEVIYPYDKLGGVSVVESHPVVRFHLWVYRSLLENRTVFGKTLRQKGQNWYGHLEHYVEKLRTPVSVAFAFVSTHNHFVLSRGGRLFKQTAPIVKLPEGATEEEHLALLGYLNSSIAGFFYRQVGHSKGAQGVNEGHKSEIWEQFLEYSGALVGSIPLPVLPPMVAALAARIDELAQKREGFMPSLFLRNGWSAGSLGQGLIEANRQAQACLSEMVGTQEEIDWLIYEQFDILSLAEREMLGVARAQDGFVAGEGLLRFAVPPGCRPFEFELKRLAVSTAWFERNGYALPPADEKSLPGPPRLVAARLGVLRENSNVRLLEAPEYKRRWTLRNFDEETREALMVLLLDAVELVVKEQAAAMPLSRLTSEVLAHPKWSEVIQFLCAPGENIEEVLRGMVIGESVPFLSVYRFTQSGLQKRMRWEARWELQRKEDHGERVESGVPPKYDSKDFRSQAFWRLRGKLDVPKERFVSYPQLEREEGRDVLLGWAGWNHLQKANALATLYQERKTQDAWEGESLVPLLSGLLELVPWLQQWHNEPNPDFNGERLGDYYSQFVTEEARSLGLTLDDLRNWRPVKAPAKKRAPKKKKVQASDTEGAA